jgi:hypothetical protein
LINDVTELWWKQQVSDALFFYQDI